MKPIKDLYWIQVEKETEDTILLNGKEMYRDTSYDPMKLARQYGTVYKTPTLDTSDAGIQEGDKVWFHHFIATPTNHVSHADKDNIYQAYLEQIYLIERKGEYIPVGVWNFMEQEMKEAEMSESGIFLDYSPSEVEFHGTAILINDWVKDQGVEVGDRVMWSENSEYEMDIDGRKLLRMRNVDILASYDR